MEETADDIVTQLIDVTCAKIVAAIKHPNTETIGDAAKESATYVKELRNGIEKTLQIVKHGNFGGTAVRFLQAASKSTQYAYIFAKFVALAVPQHPMEVHEFLDKLNGARVAQQTQTIKDAKTLNAAIKKGGGIETPAHFLETARSATSIVLDAWNTEQSTPLNADTHDLARRVVIANTFVPYGNAFATALHALAPNDAQTYRTITLAERMPFLNGTRIVPDFADGIALLKERAGIEDTDTPQEKKRKWDALKTTEWYAAFDRSVCDLYLTKAYATFAHSIGDTHQYGRNIELAFSPAFQAGYAGNGTYLPPDTAQKRYDALWEEINASPEYLNALAYMNDQTLLAF